jgi:uncharacterized RDD family membrane protein YckC
LEDFEVPENKPRSELAKSFDPVSVDDEDFFELGSYVKRTFAFVIDLFFIAVIFNIVNLIIPILKPFIQQFLEHSQFNYPSVENFSMKGAFIIIFLMALFFLFVIPSTFFNCSLGKKIFGLRLRGQDKYSLSISQVFYRELIIKPISIAIIAGFIMPFYSKKRQSLHDRLAQTFVVEN